jgi:hypothetical protein
LSGAASENVNVQEEVEDTVKCEQAVNGLNLKDEGGWKKSAVNYIECPYIVQSFCMLQISCVELRKKGLSEIIHGGANTGCGYCLI